MTSPRWRQRPPGSNWGEFGPDDECGRLNLITPEKVLQGMAEVREGRTFCLSLPLDYPGGNVLNPRRHPPVRFATVRGDRANYAYRLAQEQPTWTDVVCDDKVLLHTQYSTQWDSLAHVGTEFDADGDGTPEVVFYNGWRAGEDILGPSAEAGEHGQFEGVEARRLGIQRMAERCVQGRAVLIDLEAHFGTDHALVGYDRLMEIMAADSVTVETGDMVCLHTGFARELLAMGGHPDERVHAMCAALDGRDERLLRWITESGLSVLIADNYAVEAVPSRPGESERHPAMPLHEHCLVKLGVHLGEIWYLSELARYLREAGRSRFLLTAPPLRLPGAVGSPTTPVATV